MQFYLVEDVMAIVGVSKSKAYKIIQELNKELKDQGYITIAGKIPKKYFIEKFYCDIPETKKQKQLA